MSVWKAIRPFLPRTLKDEAKNLVAKVSRESAEPLRLRMEEQHRALEGRLDALWGGLADRDTRVSQVLSILEREHGSPGPPPKHLQVRVVGSYVPRFVESGFSICGELDTALRVVGKQLPDFPRILDFGCGCGRMSRALKARAPASELYGVDIDPEAIAWLKGNYAQFGDYRVAPHLPPMPFEDSFFDFVLSISVFTHLPEDMQFAWLRELQRITKPGGYLILTTSGPHNFPPEIREVMSTRGFLYRDGTYGQSISLPDFYQNTFHSHAYIEREWSKYFEVLDIQPRRIEAHQDATLLRRRATSP